MSAVYRVRDAVDPDQMFVVVIADDAKAAKAEAIRLWPELTPGSAKNESFHPTVGHLWKGLDGTYRCTAYESRYGFWMVNIEDPTDRRNVSERAPGRTFHRIRIAGE